MREAQILVVNMFVWSAVHLTFVGTERFVCSDTAASASTSAARVRSALRLSANG